jgi:hypothetical protein
MERRRLARFGFVLGLAGLFGCAPLPQPQVAVAPVAVPAPPLAPPAPLPVPPAPVALVAPPAPIAVTPPQPPVGPVIAAHPVVRHHHWVRRYAAVRTDYYGPPCGSVAHPCSVYHTVVPIQ